MKDRHIFIRRKLFLLFLPIMIFIIAPTSASAQDTDGDGVDDAAELELGSNPLDGQITPSVIKADADLRLSYGEDLSQYSSLVWTGSVFGVSWEDNRTGYYEIYFSRIASGGDTLGPEVRVSYSLNGYRHPSLVFTGSEFGLAWERREDWWASLGIYFIRIAPDGDTVEPDRFLLSTYTTRLPSLVWNGSEYFLTWWNEWDYDLGWYPEIFHDLYFSRISADGILIGSTTDLSIRRDWFSPYSITWTGSEYGMVRDEYWFNDVVCTDMAHVYFTRITEDGVKTGSDLELDYTICGNGFKDSSLAWTGSEFGVSWHKLWSYPGVYFTRVTDEGERAMDNIQIASSNSKFASVVWAERIYGLSWQDERDGNEEIYFAMISQAGTKIGDDLRVTFDEGASNKPSLIWTGTEFGVTWEDDRDGNYEIYFARIALDSDGDGIPDSDEINTYNTDPADWDLDDDGLSDGDEIYGLGTNPNDPDTDADGMDDGDELAAGRDPLSPDNPVPPPGRPPFGIQPGDNDVDGPFGIKCAGSVLPGTPANVWSSILFLILPGIAGLGLRSALDRRRS